MLTVTALNVVPVDARLKVPAVVFEISTDPVVPTVNDGVDVGKTPRMDPELEVMVKELEPVIVDEPLLIKSPLPWALKETVAAVTGVKSTNPPLFAVAVRVNAPEETKGPVPAKEKPLSLVTTTLANVAPLFLRLNAPEDPALSTLTFPLVLMLRTLVLVSMLLISPEAELNDTVPSPVISFPAVWEIFPEPSVVILISKTPVVVTLAPRIIAPLLAVVVRDIS